MIVGGLILAALAAAAPPSAPPATGAREGTASATEFRHGAPIRMTVSRGMTISPLRLRLVSFPPLATPGERIQIVLTVTNAGAAALSGLRPALEFVSGSLMLGPLAGPAPAAPASLGPGAAASFTWSVSVTAAGTAAVRAVVTGTVTGQGWVRGEATRALAPPAVPQLAASLTPNPVSAAAGEWFALVVTISNTGGVRASGILPAVSPTSGGGLVVLKEGPQPPKPVSLSPGEAMEFTFTFSANGSGLVSFTASVAGTADLSPPGLGTRAAGAAGRAASAAVAGARAAGAYVAATVRHLLHPPRPESEEPLFASFEEAADAAWETNGYVATSLSATAATDGAHSLAAEFMIPTDLTRSPTGDFRPALRLTAPARGMRRPLAPRDWSPFRSLKADALVLAGVPLAITVTLVDLRGRRHEETRLLPPGTATTFEIPLEGARNDRLDLSRLAVFELAADTAAHAARPVLHLDRLRFTLPPVPPGASTVLVPSGVVPSRTGTGQPR